MQHTSPHNPLTSKDNSTIKHLRSLSEPKFRKKEKSFLIEGVKMVEEALSGKAGLKTVVAAPSLVQHHGKGILKLAQNRGVEIVWISDRLMDLVSESKTPQPVMAVAPQIEYEQDLLFKGSGKLIVVAHQLQDPGNLGTIIRTSEAAGASGVVTTHATVDPFHPKSVRASMGSILRLPVISVHNAEALLKACKQRGFQTMATVLKGKTTHFDVDFKKPTVVLVGQEGAGLPGELMDDIDLAVRIPMADTIDSLNVATAAAIILYEAIRQRGYGKT